MSDAALATAINELRERVIALEREKDAELPVVTLSVDPDPLVGKRVYFDVCLERACQTVEHGGDGHDDTHTAFDWCRMIVDHNQRAYDAAGHGSLVDGGLTGEARDAWRRQMVRVAALAIAAVESHDRLDAQGLV